jgi:pyruvate kinase
MVARGDLGVECGFATVASNQKLIVSTARRWGKPVIVATQMLDSMIENPRPTHAEICDVANAVFDLADATMLSGESASGKYSGLAVRTMREIASKVDHCGKLNTDQTMDELKGNIITETIAQTVAQLSEKIQASAIVCLTLTGSIARSVSKYRPYAPIIALSPRPDVVRKMSLVRGVIGIQNPLFFDTDAALGKVGKFLAKAGLVEEDDLVIITGGIPISKMQPSNTVKIQRIVKQDFQDDSL